MCGTPRAHPCGQRLWEETCGWGPGSQAVFLGEAAWAEILRCHLWGPEKATEMDSGSKQRPESHCLGVQCLDTVVTPGPSHSPGSGLSAPSTAGEGACHWQPGCYSFFFLYISSLLHQDPYSTPRARSLCLLCVVGAIRPFASVIPWVP